VYRIIVENKKGTKVDKGWACDLVPADLVIDRYFSIEKKHLEQLDADRETIAAKLTELEEEHSGEDGFFADMEKVNKAAVQKRLKELQEKKSKTRKEVIAEYNIAAEAEATFGADEEELTEEEVLKKYLSLIEKQSKLTAQIKEATDELDKKTLAKYPTLNEDDIKQLVVDDKWMTSIQKAIHSEMERISQRLAQRIKDLAERYETPLPQQNKEVAALEEKVNDHLSKMGFKWK
jgi:type I restriction enzyme M protein